MDGRVGYNWELMCAGVGTSGNQLQGYAESVQRVSEVCRGCQGMAGDVQGMSGVCRGCLEMTGDVQGMVGEGKHLEVGFRACAFE